MSQKTIKEEEVKEVEGPKEKAPNGIVDSLRCLQACMMVAKMNVKQHHWTMHGPGGVEIHQELDCIADMYACYIDKAAESTVLIGGSPVGRFSEALECSLVKEDDDVDDTKGAVEWTIKDMRTIKGCIVACCTACTGEPGVEAWLGELACKLDKKIYLFSREL